MFCGTMGSHDVAFKPNRSNSVDSGLHLQAGSWLTNGKGSLEAALPRKPALARSASQKLLNTARLVPPIHRSSVWRSQDAHHQDLPSQDKSPHAAAGELPGGPRSEASEGLAEPAMDPEEVKISLQHLRSSAEKKRKLLGASLFPPSLKLPSPSKGSFQPLLSGPVQAEAPAPIIAPFERDAFVQEPSSARKERKLQVPGHGVIQSTPSLVEKIKGERSPASQAMVISFKLSTELGPVVNRWKSMEGEGAETEERARTERLTFTNDMASRKQSGEVLQMDPRTEVNKSSKASSQPLDLPQLCHVTISKSAQEKLRQKRKEELEQQQLRKERELAHYLKEQPQERNPLGTSLPVQELLNTREFSKINLCSPAFRHGTSLRKRIKVPSLPSIPNISQMCNVSWRFSAHSLPDLPLDSTERERKSDEEGSLEMNLFSHQEQGLTEALKLLANSDWEIKRQGLSSVRCLARLHQEVLLTKLHVVCLAVMKEVSNLRSKVACSAMLTLGELFSQLKRGMDQEAEEVARILLHRTGDSNEFIREEAVKALAVMAQSVSPPRALTALIAGGLNHRNSMVRRCTAANLLRVVEDLGAERLLSGNKGSVDQIVQSMVKFLQDGNQETRFYGQKLLNILVSHPEFGRYLEPFLMSQDLHHIITAIKQRGLRDGSSDIHSPKGRRSRFHSTSNSQEDVLITGRPEHDAPWESRLVPQRLSQRRVDTMERVKQLSKTLTAKEFQERMQGISLLLQHCETYPRFVTSNIVDIFDAFTPRLQDPNKKVNQFALQSLVTMIPALKDDLHRVLHLTVATVTDNLNSKNTGIYTAAVQVLDTLIDHIDNLLLLQPFASRVQFISGRARQDITERLAVLVLPVYERKPQTVERYVLPVLWYLLGNMSGNGVIKGGSGNMRAATAKLASSLHQRMGTGLQEYAQSQPAHVIKTLWDLTEKEL
ncbi:TOG array regulator of axonemal microtubules protein 2-like [Narcine bancroftii]|uniref:TOG array regulator of axonemal microtubules protein 2-like n=1 Tax=Narcine bancroftii TaxID=1343680 RepID=UPI003831E182